MEATVRNYNPIVPGPSKTLKIVYWVSTTIFVLFDAVGAIFMNSQLAIDGIRHMGFPDYFRYELSIGKIIGGLLLMLPFIPARFKEWAYVGFGISLISAFIGHVALGDTMDQTLMPVVVFAIFLTSYISYHQILKQKRPAA